MWTTTAAEHNKRESHALSTMTLWLYACYTSTCASLAYDRKISVFPACCASLSSPYCPLGIIGMYIGLSEASRFAVNVTLLRRLLVECENAVASAGFHRCQHDDQQVNLLPSVALTVARTLLEAATPIDELATTAVCESVSAVAFLTVFSASAAQRVSPAKRSSPVTTY